MAFDNRRIREAFHSHSLQPPEPNGFVDTLQLLRKSFGKRAGNMKVCRGTECRYISTYYSLGLAFMLFFVFPRIGAEHGSESEK